MSIRFYELVLNSVMLLYESGEYRRVYRGNTHEGGM